MIAEYTDESIISLNWWEHIRKRPGMYIGKLGDGSSTDDGIYVLIKEVIDNSVDEFVMGGGRMIEVTVRERNVTIRDYGRGIPLTKVLDCANKINTGAKYDSEVFKKSVGLNGVGLKAVNALTSFFKIQSVREKQMKSIEFSKGEVIKDEPVTPTDARNGIIINFIPDEEIFGNYHFLSEYIEKMLWNYAYLNNGLIIYFNGEKIQAKNGLFDLLTNNIDDEILYPVVHIREDDFEFAFSHYNNKYGEEYYSFVNGQHTTQGGTHQAAFREGIVKTIREFYKKDFDPADIRASIVAALSIKVQEPVFESQTKTKLGSQLMEKDGRSIRTFVNDMIKRTLDNFLHMNPETAAALQEKILVSQKERKEIANIKKIAKESVKKVSLHNKKLRDCRIHLNTNHDQKLDSTLFITEGDSASGSITKSRDVNTQAVFSLKGKPLNCYGMSKKVVYENEEFNLLQSALNIEEGIDNLRYNNIVIATDADVDGMHIRLLLLTFFLQFYPDVIKAGHVFILQTPLFRVRNKKKTLYCYTETERLNAVSELGPHPEITRFKGLGEISPDEFKHFIGPSMHLDPVMLHKDTTIGGILSFYMGKNTPERQEFIINNLRIEDEPVNGKEVIFIEAAPKEKTELAEMEG